MLPRRSPPLQAQLIVLPLALPLRVAPLLLRLLFLLYPLLGDVPGLPSPHPPAPSAADVGIQQMVGEQVRDVPAGRWGGDGHRETVGGMGSVTFIYTALEYVYAVALIS